MLTTVPLNPRPIEDYRAAIGDAAMKVLGNTVPNGAGAPSRDG
jgi:hypothetical protein